jgi:hypothetical protein
VFSFSFSFCAQISEISFVNITLFSFLALSIDQHQLLLSAANAAADTDADR